jgi:hypothetical protein
VPRGWEDAIAVITYIFHFPPSELAALEFGAEFGEIEWWLDKAKWINEKRDGR